MKNKKKKKKKERKNLNQMLVPLLLCLVFTFNSAFVANVATYFI